MSDINLEFLLGAMPAAEATLYRVLIQLIPAPSAESTVAASRQIEMQVLAERTDFSKRWVIELLQRLGRKNFIRTEGKSGARKWIRLLPLGVPLLGGPETNQSSQKEAKSPAPNPGKAKASRVATSPPKRRRKETAPGPKSDARRGRRVWAIKGDGGARPVWPRKESKARKGKVWLIGVDSPKATLAARLRITEGPGRVHFPVMVGLAYFERLNSEYLKTTYRRGRPERTWERRKGRAAEGLDCAVYSYAALCGLRAHGVDLDQEVARLELLRPAAARSEPAPAYPVYRSRFVGR